MASSPVGSTSVASRRGVIAGGLALAAAPLAARAPLPSRSVRVPAGDFHGAEEDRVVRFLGIRYGTAERFRAPRPLPRATAPVPALAYGPSCPQRSGIAPTAEDCLFLNVWTTAPGRAARLPVLVYFHGGAYTTGSVVDPLTDGQPLAARGDCVIVTVNHRLNAFGYLYLARLDPRLPDSGNAGQLDLVLALRWVCDNIAGFGGDPGRVTVFGQSGGGAKIATLMAMPAARGLFHRAMTMSGQQVTASGPLNATARARAYLSKLGDPSIDALLAMPAERLIEGLSATDPILGGGVYMGPVLDLRALTRHPFWPDAAPQSNAIPMILGNTRRETGSFIDPNGPKLRGLDWTNIAERMTSEIRVDLPPEWVVAQYRARFPEWSATDVFYDATTILRSWPGQVIEADARAAAGAATWVYQVDFASRTDPRRGAFHTIDIPLAFGTLAAAGSQTGTAADARSASRTLQDALLRLAATGDPGWPRYTLPRRTTMVVDTRSRPLDDPRRWQREMLARVPYVQPGT